MVGGKPDYYRILGVKRSASKTDLRRAYHRLARKYHPDINAAPNAESVFKRINEAYEILSDKLRRAEFDRVSQLWQAEGRAAYADPSILDEFIASHFDEKGDIRRERACLFSCPHCGGEATVFFDFAILSWQNFSKRCDVCSESILIDYEVYKNQIIFFDVKPCH